MKDFDHAWTRIMQLQGMPFRQKKGRESTYCVASGTVIPSNDRQDVAEEPLRGGVSSCALIGPGQLQEGPGARLPQKGR